MKKDFLKDVYFDYNEKHGVDIARHGNLQEAEKELDSLISGITDFDLQSRLDVSSGILSMESEYKGFLLGLLAAAEDKKLCSFAVSIACFFGYASQNTEKRSII